MFVGPTGVTLANPPNHERQKSEHAVQRLQHIIVIYQENWSFDSLYGEFPGANGLANAGASVQQVDKNGQPYASLPQPLDTNQKPPAADSRFPASLPVAPYDLDTYAPADQKFGDLVG